MLVLRAGVGAGGTRSRAAVAKRLRTSVRRVAKLERSGLERLRTLCGGAPAVTPGAGVIAREVSAPVAASGNPSRADRRRASAATPEPVRSTVKAPSLGGVEGRSATNVPAPPDRIDLAVPILLVLLGVAGFVTGRLMSRGRNP